MTRRSRRAQQPKSNRRYTDADLRFARGFQREIRRAFDEYDRRRGKPADE